MAPYKFKLLSHKDILSIQESFKKFSNFIKPITDGFPNVSTDASSDDGKRTSVSKKLPSRLVPARSNDSKPARTIEELEAKLKRLKGKPGLPYKEKLQKKGLKSRLRKKEKKDMIKLKRQEAREQAKLEKEAIGEIERKHPAKPVFNQEGEVVFSKFDFSELGAKADKPKIKQIKEPKVALKKLNEERKRLKELEDKGEKEKVLKIKEKKAWKGALLKSEGVRIKDDPELLKNSVKKIKKRKEKSKQKWKANLKRVEAEKEERQRKRTENLQSRSRDKKMKKLKAMSKRGRVIAGF